MRAQRFPAVSHRGSFSLRRRRRAALFPKFARVIRTPNNETGYSKTVKKKNKKNMKKQKNNNNNNRVKPRRNKYRPPYGAPIPFSTLLLFYSQRHCKRDKSDRNFICKNSVFIVTNKIVRHLFSRFLYAFRKRLTDSSHSRKTSNNIIIVILSIIGQSDYR